MRKLQVIADVRILYPNSLCPQRTIVFYVYQKGTTKVLRCRPLEKNFPECFENFPNEFFDIYVKLLTWQASLPPSAKPAHIIPSVTFKSLYIIHSLHNCLLMTGTSTSLMAGSYSEP